MLALIGIVVGAAGLFAAYQDRAALKARALSAEASLVQKLLTGERELKAKVAVELAAAFVNAKTEALKLEAGVAFEVCKAIEAVKVEVKSRL